MDGWMDGLLLPLLVFFCLLVSFVCFLRLFVIATLCWDDLVGLRSCRSGCVALAFSFHVHCRLGLGLLLFQLFSLYGFVNFSSVHWVTLSFLAALLAVFLWFLAALLTFVSPWFFLALHSSVYLYSVSNYFSSFAIIRQWVFCISVFLVCWIAYRYMRLSFFFFPFGSLALASVLRVISFTVHLPLSSSSLRFFSFFGSFHFRFYPVVPQLPLLARVCFLRSFSFCLAFL